MKVLVSGAHGFLGSCFVAYLKKKKIPHIVYNRRHSERTSLSFTHAIHFGGLTPYSLKDHAPTAAEYYAANVIGTKKFLALVAANSLCKKIISIGSASEYGFSRGLISENAPLRPRTAYGHSKVEQERAMKQFAHKHRISVTTLRVFNIAAIFRKRSYSNAPLFENLREQFLRHPSTVQIAHKESARDFVDPHDITDAAFRALSVPQKQFYQAINICSGRAVTIGSVVALFSARYRHPVVIKNTQSKPDRLIGNPQKARRILRWKAKTSLERSVAKMVP